MAMFERSDDVVLALQMATELMAGRRFRDLAEANGDEAAAGRVVAVADVLMARMRRTASLNVGAPVIEEDEPPISAKEAT